MPNVKEPLMLACYPRYNTKFNYTASFKEIELIKEIIKCIRNIKAKTGAAPSKKVNLYVKSEKFRAINKNSVYICKLAGVDNVYSVKDKAEINEKVISQVLDGAEIFVPLGELVDFEQELIRLKKELLTAENEVKRASGKLSNSGFLEKAPKALVDAEREKRDTYLTIVEKIKNQIKELEN